MQFSLKDQVIMVYLSKENPIVETSKERIFKEGDIISLENGLVYELVSMGDTCILKNLLTTESTIEVSLEDFILEKNASKKVNQMYRFEKVTKILNSRWEGDK